MKKLKTLLIENYALIAFTFQVFWIIVFCLDRMGAGGGGGVPQFVYVNF
jgi:hypothetical protein